MSLNAQSAGAAAILYTDVDRDGTLTGPNIERTRLLASKLFIPVIASGGVSCLEDVLTLVSTGASAVVVGKALYSGKIDLKHALSVLRRASNDESQSPIQS
jgi:phosphoribosylformimino-5-aminoimidazole carboxamide ribotide isomerase